MLDLRLIRENRDLLVYPLERRGFDSTMLDSVIKVDAERRQAQVSVDIALSEQKRLSKEIPFLQGSEKEFRLARLRSLSEMIDVRRQRERELKRALHQLLLRIPNIPDESAPDKSLEVRTWGSPPMFDFTVRDHVEIGTLLDIIDVDRGVRTSGSRFYYLKGQAVLLEMALVRYVLDILMHNSFTPVMPPVLVRREALEGTGFLPTDEQQIYRLPDDDLYLVGTSEVPLAALHMDEFLEPIALPLRYCGISTCFRREAGTYGKDTRGIFRVHQFDKVEMFSFTSRDQSGAEHEFLLAIQEKILRGLEIPYRVVNIAAGELGASAAKKYDCEAWLPSQADYRELTSCSNCTDYQARRLNCRETTLMGPAFVHTLNGTAIAITRAIIALLENHQRADGTVGIPNALQQYFGHHEIRGEY